MSFEDKTFKQSGKTTTTEWQQEVLSLVTSSGTFGITDSELQEATGKGHGSTSSALSLLHKRGLIHRLEEKRDRFSVYVHPKARIGREIIAPKNNRGEDLDHTVCRATETILILQIEELKERLRAFEGEK